MEVIIVHLWTVLPLSVGDKKKQCVGIGLGTDDVTGRRPYAWAGNEGAVTTQNVRRLAHSMARKR